MNCFQPRANCQCSAEERASGARDTRAAVRVADGEKEMGEMEEPEEPGEPGEEVLGEEDFDIMRECRGRE